MLKVSQDIGKTSFKGLRRLNHRLEPAVSSPEIRALKIFLGILRIAVVPKSSHNGAPWQKTSHQYQDILVYDVSSCYVDCQVILQEALFFSILLLMVTFMAPG